MKKTEILLVDVGNTSVCISVGGDSTISCPVRLKTVLCCQKSVRKVIRQVLGSRKPAGCVLCSVVPGLNDLWSDEMHRAIGLKPILVHHRLNLGLALDYPKPASIGADRLANVCGAVGKYGSPVMVVDLGTATTFDVVSARGAFIGGVIAPGPRLMLDYMADRTAQLPRIKMEGKCPGIGLTTEEAMRIAAVVGYHGLIREITGYLIRCNSLKGISLVATGGFAKETMKGLNMPFVVDSALTLQGLYRIFELNAG